MTDIAPGNGDATEDEPTDAPGAETDPRTEAWKRTVAEARALADERAEEGWDARTVVAGHTAPTSHDSGRDDRFGLVFVVPGNHADAVADAFERGGFSEYEVYRNAVDRTVYIVVEYRDPDARRSLFLVGAYDVEGASAAATAAEREGEMHTHLRTLDGTVLGTVSHEAYEKFFPDVTDFGN